MSRIFLSLAALALLFATGCSRKSSLPTGTPCERVVVSAAPGHWAGDSEVRNIIFIVGDGMGTAQVYSSIVAEQGASQFLRFPFTGFSRTYSLDKYTTDSGAGGTALMTGHKVENHHIALSPEGVPHPSFLSLALQQGKKVGFVVTSSVLDATPASTYAHVPDRNMKDTISLQMAQCGFDVMIGGDKGHFEVENRHDGTAPLDTLRQRGYSLAFSLDEMDRASGSRLCALVSPDSPEKAPQRDNLLVRGTRKALRLLENADQGFVLMIEGSQIDWACHNNDSTNLREELADFEQMLRVVLDFAEHDGHTLVVVTADHETGGLALKGGDIDKGINVMSFSTQGHSGCMVPVFAFGPGAENFTGVMQNVDLFPKFLKLLH